MTAITLNNPYEQGTIVHQNFNGSLSHYSRQSDEQLEQLMKENRSKADNFLNYSMDQMDYFERECRAIQMVLDSRA